MSTVSIAGLSKASVLAALYNASKPLGMGFMHYDAKPMSEADAQEIIDNNGLRFDYLKGRVMKVDLSEDDVRTDLYDRDNGDGSAENVIRHLTLGGAVNAQPIAEQHAKATREAALDLDEHLGVKSEMKREGNMLIFTPGLSDVAPLLRPHLDAVLGKPERDSDEAE